MPPPERQYDALGFPIPADFEDEPSRRGSQNRRGNSVRWALLIVCIALLSAAVLSSPVRDVAGDMASQWHHQQANEAQGEGDLEGAIRHLDKALDWTPDRGELYLVRSNLLQQLERHAEAIADANKAVELTGGRDASALNHRAYIRARANLELDEGLKDIQTALAMIGWPFDDPLATDSQELQSVFDKWTMDRDIDAYLDTRAYLFHRLGDQESAMADIKLAIGIAEGKKDYLLRRWGYQTNSRNGRIAVLRHNLNLAVMYHHRGEILQAMGEEAKAEEDFRLAEELGYNPALGVY